MVKRQSRYAKGVKRGRAYRASGKYPLRHYYGPNANKAAASIQAVVRRTLAKNIETKQSNHVVSNGQEIQHNNFITVNANLLATTQGVNDPITGDTGNRIGDEINLSGVSIRGMLELNSRYSEVFARVVIVKSAKGDTPTYSTLFQGICENKMLDRYNTERYTILASKIIKLRAPNKGTITSTNPADGSGFATGGNETLSRATRIFKMWIPGGKFVRGGKIKYENFTSQPKFFDYTMLIFAFANESVSSLPGTPWNVCSLQDSVITMYYKDA